MKHCNTNTSRSATHGLPIIIIIVHTYLLLSLLIVIIIIVRYETLQHKYFIQGMYMYVYIYTYMYETLQHNIHVCMKHCNTKIWHIATQMPHTAQHTVYIDTYILLLSLFIVIIITVRYDTLQHKDHIQRDTHMGWLQFVGSLKL